MSVVGKHLGSSLGAWLGAGGEPVASYVDAALFVVGAGSALLWPDVINRPPQPTATGGGYGFLPEKKPRRDTDDDLLMCFLL